ncbi:MAG TPA: MBL fold metallo-hydrolase [Burkholderiales bacterium]|nr:MBL fold metallo-hydrolase [Burkholderiales bacterium]
MNDPARFARRLIGIVWFVPVLLIAGPVHACALHPQQVAAGVYALIGVLQEAAPTNCGNIINTGFIVGTAGVIVIDTGANRTHGTRILSAIRKLTRKPVAAVFDTQAQPENVLGNSVFAKPGVPIFACARTVATMRSECRNCYRNLRAVLGAKIMAGTRIVQPTHTLRGTTEMQIAGRGLRLICHHGGPAAGGLAVLDRRTGVLFAGGLVAVDRIPALGQANTAAWIAALEALRKERITRIVPGMGPVSAPARVAGLIAYLKGLQTIVARRYRAGQDVLETLHDADMPAWHNWALYNSVHPLNIQHVYFEIEREDLER